MIEFLAYFLIYGYPMIILIAIVLAIVHTSIKERNTDSALKSYDAPPQARFGGVECIFAGGDAIKVGSYLVWKDNKNLIFLEDSYNKITGHWAKKIKIPVEQVEYYKLTSSGQYIQKTNTDIKNKLSAGGAVVGGMIAGVPGAIIGGRKKVVKTTHSTEYVEAHITDIYLNENGTVTEYSFLGDSAYDILLSLVPHKEYRNYILKHQNGIKKGL